MTDAGTPDIGRAALDERETALIRVQEALRKFTSAQNYYAPMKSFLPSSTPLWRRIAYAVVV
jgi:hypothetical protein